ncbi:MAG: TRAP transporter large permease subunit [Desulfovermiculus sp.]|nr:TRAP transporter large permease subunit [Desulfovermiculus sp.]
MEHLFVNILVLISMLGLIFLGAPIFLALGFSGLLGIFILRGFMGLFQIPGAIFGQIDHFVLVAIPLFILMGEVLFYTNIGRDIYDAFSRWLYKVPGGLAVASVFACAIFGALCGVSIAGVATIGMMAIPEMLNRGYNKPLSAGSVTAAGALAMLIPPSLLFILYGSIARVSVGKLFIGGIVPGILLACFMAIYIIIRCLINPSLAPKEYTEITWKERILPLKRLWTVVVLILLVLGSIYLGVATPTESAAMGAVGAFVIAIFVYKRIDLNTFRLIIYNATRTSGSLLIIFACAMSFSNYLSYVRIPDKLSEFVLALPIPDMGIFLIFMVLIILLGMFIDGASLVIITTPLLLPVIIGLGFDPLWYGIILVINLEMAVITPPVGLNLYALRGVTKEEDISMKDIIGGTLPYVGLEFAALLFFIFVPGIIMWLPNMM